MNCKQYDPSSLCVIFDKYGLINDLNTKSPNSELLLDNLRKLFSKLGNCSLIAGNIFGLHKSRIQS